MTGVCPRFRKREPKEEPQTAKAAVCATPLFQRGVYSPSHIAPSTKHPGPVLLAALAQAQKATLITSDKDFDQVESAILA